MLALLVAHTLLASASAQVAPQLLWQAPLVGASTLLFRSLNKDDKLPFPRLNFYMYGSVAFSPDGTTLFAAQALDTNTVNPLNASIQLVALRADNGESKWRYPANPDVLSIPIPSKFTVPFYPTLTVAENTSMLYLSYITPGPEPALLFTAAITAAGEKKWASTVFFPTGYLYPSVGLPLLSVAGDLWVPGAASGPKASVSAFNAVTGESTGGVAPPGDAILSAALRWTAEFDPSRSTLVFAAVNTSNYNFFAIDARTRLQVWWLTVPLPAACNPDGGCFPLFALTTAAALYTVVPDANRNVATLYGFSLATGQPLPNSPLQLPDASYVSTTQLVALSNGQLLFNRYTSLPSGVSCTLVDPTSGKEIWRSATLQGYFTGGSIVSADEKAVAFGGTCAECSSERVCTCSTGAKLYFLSLATGAVTTVEANATYATPLAANPCTGGVDFFGGVLTGSQIGDTPTASSSFGHASGGALVWATAQLQGESGPVGCAPATRTVAVAGAVFNPRQLLSLYQLPAAPPAAPSAAPQSAATATSASSVLLVVGGVLGGAALLAAAAAAFSYRALLARSLQRVFGGAPEESPLLMK
jgi:outer membrane protein assembly factor BamB